MGETNGSTPDEAHLSAYRLEVGFIVEGGQGFVVLTERFGPTTHEIKLAAKQADAIADAMKNAATKAGLGLHLPQRGPLDL